MMKILRCLTYLLMSFGISFYSCVASASIIYVNPDATGAASGMSWKDACTTIQAGVNAAVSGDEVWVVKGTYNATTNPGVAMKAGVALYGGFVGTESSRDARDAASNVTIINGAGQYRCITGASNAVLDGFTVTAGYLDSGNGGAMHNSSCTGLTISNCTFSNNSASSISSSCNGGALYNNASSISISNCTFSGNTISSESGESFGGAIYSASASTLNISYCTFNMNQANTVDSANGGALASSSSTLTISHCSFTSNSVTSNYIDGLGGALYNISSNVTLLDNVFMENSASGTNGIGEGGAIYNLYCSPSITNCTFTANSASGSIIAAGGAIANSNNSSPSITNCTFTANTTGGYGGAIYNFTNCSPVITNCILYNDTASGSVLEITNEESSNPIVTYSCVSGGYVGTANINGNPYFVDGTPDSDGVDLRLQSNSQCIDKGTDTSASVAASATDILGAARPSGLTYDMGAYEYIAPVAAFSLSVTSGMAPLAVTFTDASTATTTSPITSWAWNFGDGTASSEQNPTHTYLSVGAYTISLTVTTALGTSSVTHSVTIEHGAAVITAWPVASGITYGQTLAASLLSGGAADTTGAFSFADTSIKPGAGVHFGTVVFTPTDHASYDSMYATTTVAVAKATPTVSSWPTAGNLTYGQALSASSLSGGASSVNGAFAFTRPDLKPAAGTYSAGVTFTATEAANYVSVSGSTDVEVQKASPVISTMPTASAIIYGQRLSDSVLSGGQATVDSVAIAGVFSFTTPTDAPTSAGDYPAAITFTPADANNYLIASGYTSVPVTMAECPDCESTSGPYTAGDSACLLVPGTFSSSATFTWMRQDNAALDPTHCTGIYCQHLKISDLLVTDSGDYQCTYTDGSNSDVYTVTITVTEAQSVPLMPHGRQLIAIVALIGLLATWRYRRSLSA